MTSLLFLCTRHRCGGSSNADNSNSPLRQENLSSHVPGSIVAIIAAPENEAQGIVLVLVPALSVIQAEVEVEVEIEVG